MKRPFGASLAALILIVLPAICRGGFKVGDALPDLASFNLEGKLPDQLKGKVILLDFWASWCPPCKVSFPVMDDLRKQYADRGLTIIAVSVDEERPNMEEFLKEVKVSFCTMRDGQQKLVAAADVPTMPTSFLINRAGKIRFVHDGYVNDQTPREYKAEIEQLVKEANP